MSLLSQDPASFLSYPDTRDHLTYEIERSGDFVCVSFRWHRSWWERWVFGEPTRWGFGMTTDQAQRFAELFTRVLG